MAVSKLEIEQVANGYIVYCAFEKRVATSLLGLAEIICEQLEIDWSDFVSIFREDIMEAQKVKPGGKNEI